MPERIWYSVDRSWGNTRSNADGDLYPSDFRRFHLDRGDTTAACSPRIVLNSLKGDVGERESDLNPGERCGNCLRRSHA